MKVFCFALSILIVLCLVSSGFAATPQKYTVRYMDVFDTVTTIIAYADCQEDFDAFAEQVHALLKQCHQIFDYYHTYEGVHNLCFINQKAAMAPVKAEPELFQLLSWLKEMQPLTHNKVNAAAGALLAVWHEARKTNTLPEKQALLDAAQHIDFDQVILSADDMTVHYLDPLIKIDLGAVAKGFVTEYVISKLDHSPVSSYILNLGGNIKCVGMPQDGRSAWTVGIQDPTDPNLHSDLVFLKDLSAVTSGDYQRFFEVDGIRYHHIIDPDTLYPSNHLRSVTIITENALLADFLSTSLFLLSYEDGCALLEALDDTVYAYWYFSDHTIAFTEELSFLLHSTQKQSDD